MADARCPPPSAVTSLLLALPLLLCIALSALPLSASPASSANEQLISSLLHQAAAYRYGLPPNHSYDYNAFYRPTYSSAATFTASTTSFSAFAFSSFAPSASPAPSPAASRPHYPQSLERAVALYHEAAALNSSVALVSLGELYLYGSGSVVINITRAADFLQHAATLGNGRAHHLLAFLYTTSLLSPPNPHTPPAALATVHSYFAAVAYDPLALAAFGFRHMHGLAVPRSCETSVRFYMRLAQRVADELANDPTNRLMERVRLQDIDEGLAAGRSSIVSDVVEEDRLYYYQAAAERGDTAAALALGHAHTYGFHGLLVDYVTALHYYQQAADGGDVAAQTRVAFMKLHGLGCPKQQHEALTLLLTITASPSPTPASLALLGHMYEHGLATPVSLLNAASLYTEAAQHNHTAALYHLGRFHFSGLGGLSKSFDSAAECWHRCALAGHTLCMHRMAEIQRLGLTGVASCDLAVGLYKAVAERGSWLWGMEDAYRRFVRGDLEGALMTYLRLGYEGVEIAQSNAAYLLHLNYGYSAIKRSALLPQTTTSTSVLPTSSSSSSAYHHHRHSLAHLYFSHSALQSNPVSHRMIGDIHYYGKEPLTAPDYPTALIHYQLAADAGNAHAAFNLGWLKEWVSGDWAGALQWYERSGGLSSEAVAVVWLARVRLRVHRWIRERGWLVWGGLGAVWHWQWKGWDHFLESIWMVFERFEDPILVAIVVVVAVFVQHRRRAGLALRQ